MDTLVKVKSLDESFVCEYSDYIEGKLYTIRITENEIRNPFGRDYRFVQHDHYIYDVEAPLNERYRLYRNSWVEETNWCSSIHYDEFNLPSNLL